MKYRLHKFIPVLFFCILSLDAFPQAFADRLQQFIADDQNINGAGIKNPAQVRKFYTLLGFKPAWVGKEDKKNVDDLSEVTARSSLLGLEEGDYKSDYYFQQVPFLQLKNSTDSILLELQYTDMALRFLKDLYYGNTAPVLGYNGLNYSPSWGDIPELLASHLSSHTLSAVINEHSHELPEIIAMDRSIARLHAMTTDGNFKEVIIVSAGVNGKNKQLLVKLYQLGILDSLSDTYPDSLIKQKVKEVQRQFNLYDDGTLRLTTIEALNVPLSIRFRQLKLSINYYRWLYCLTRNQSVIVVNIPAAWLKVYHDSQVILEMRMIVGKRSTPTPTLASRVNEVILYPYWNVPHSIATKELLPSIKKDPGFIALGDFQVLNNSGKVVDPYSVNWQELNAKNFPYTIRQSTGCDNALGLLKLNFYSPYGVYLHDTPVKGLFLLNNRYFSHGCMRMEMPLELGHLVLKNNQIAIDTLTEKGCLRNQSPITVPADEHMPVVVWYNPAGIDSSGRIIFYEDVYKKFDWMKRNVK